MQNILHFVASWWWVWMTAAWIFVLLNGDARMRFATGKGAWQQTDGQGPLSESFKIGERGAHKARAIEKSGKDPGWWVVFTGKAATTTILLFCIGAVLKLSGY